MDNHNELGIEGEALAEKWLVRNGYTVLHRNWKIGHYEIDIIAEKKGTLHIVEVKTRWASPFGFPEDNVTKKKFSFLKKAAHAFLQLNPYDWIQYDILAITFYKDREPEYFLLKDVYI